MVKGHPAYSGTIMTATFQMVRELGWDYFEKLSKQRVMQVQSSTDPPKKLALGERAVMADGNEYGVVLLKEAGQPVEPVYPTEGTPTISGPTGIFATAPHPNAARLFQAWLHTRETQQFFIDFTAQYSVHAQVQAQARTPQDFRHQADEGRSPPASRRWRKRSRRAMRSCFGCEMLLGRHSPPSFRDASEATQTRNPYSRRTMDSGLALSPRPGMTDERVQQ